MNTEENTEFHWYSGRDVLVTDDVLTWKVGRVEHDIHKAYKAAPHREFIAADTDDALRMFVKRWGPLRRSDEGRDSIVWYRHKRDFLTATVRLIGALET